MPIPECSQGNVGRRLGPKMFIETLARSIGYRAIKRAGDTS